MLALGDWAQSLVRERERALREQMALRMLAEAEEADDAAAINLQVEHLRAAQERLDETLKGAVEDSSGYASLIEAVENLPQDGADANLSTVSSTAAAVSPRLRWSVCVLLPSRCACCVPV